MQRACRGSAAAGARFAEPVADMRVLIVDDYPGLVELIDLALGARGFVVVGAATAGAAMTLAATQPFDAVVLDLQLPDGSGSELRERMRALPQLASAKFVAMSSFEGHAQRSCFDAFLAKPFSPKRLAAMLRRLVPSCNASRNGVGRT
jgi:CheY-like chemotaxis protein